MIAKSYVPLFFILILFACNVNVEEELKNSFHQYKNAILEGNGALALQYLDQNTQDYYAYVHQQALEADSLTLSQFSLNDRLNILLARHLVPADSLQILKGEDYLAYALNHRMIGDASLRSLEFEKVVEQKWNKAVGTIKQQGSGVGVPYRFVKEGGIWKIDLTSVFKGGNRVLTVQLAQVDSVENRALIRLLEANSRRKTSSDIWEPIGN